MSSNTALVLFGIITLICLFIFSADERKQEGHPVQVRELMEQLTAILLAEGDLPVVSEWDQHIASVEVSDEPPLSVVILFEAEQPNG